MNNGQYNQPTPTTDFQIVPMHDLDAEIVFLEGLLARVQAALRRRAGAVAAIWAGAAALMLPAAVLLVDAACGFGAAGRIIVYPASILAGAAAVALAAATARMQAPSAFYVARLIETARPELKNSLITFAELRADPSIDPAMAVAVGRRAARILAKSDLEFLISPAPLRRPVAAMAVASGVLAASLWLAQGILFAPWVATAEASLASRTKEVRSAECGVRSERQTTTTSFSRDPQGSASLRHSGTFDRDDQAKFDRLAAALGAKEPESPAKAAGAHAQPSAGHGNSPATDDGPKGGAPSRADQAKFDGPSATPGASGAESPDPADAKSPPFSRAPTGRAPTPAESAMSPGAADGTGPLGFDGGGRGPSRPEQAAPAEPPLPRRPQSSEFPKEALDVMRQSQRLLEGADRRLRDGEATDAFLGRMGMGGAEFRRFVSAWQQNLVAAAAGPDVTAGPQGVRSVAGNAQADIARPTGAPAGRSIGGLAAAESRGAVETAQSAVSPRLRRAVAAYFETVGRLGAEPGSKKDAPR